MRIADSDAHPDLREERSPWFREWFGEEYLALYPHRDVEEAERGARLFRRATGLPAGGRVLDLACGAGRHLEALRRLGYRPLGLDLSPDLLRRSRERVGPDVPLARADMRRLPVGAARLDGTVLFFTSFGYFDDLADDARVLAEIRRTLRPGGVYLLDHLNPDHVRRTLVREDETRLGGRRVRQIRRIEGEAVVKRIEIEAEEPGAGPEVYHERVRLYSPDRLEALLEEARLPPARRFGDYDGGEFAKNSPRLILVGKAR